MLVYALNKEANKALTIGCLFWFPAGKEIKDMDDHEILQYCRPTDPKCRSAFDLMLEDFGNTEIVLKAWLPKGCRVVRGYWETEHAR